MISWYGGYVQNQLIKYEGYQFTSPNGYDSIQMLGAFFNYPLNDSFWIANISMSQAYYLAQYIGSMTICFTSYSSGSYCQVGSTKPLFTGKSYFNNTIFTGKFYDLVGFYTEYYPAGSVLHTTLIINGRI